MTNRAMLVSIVVKLVERVSAPLDRIIGKIGRLSAVTDRIGRLTSRIGDLGKRIGVVGALGAALSFVGPLQAAAKYDAALRDLAITSGTTSQAMQGDVAGMAKSYEKLALAVGQRSSALTEAAQILIAAGLDRKVVDALLPQVGRATTAAGAEIADMAKMTVALNQNLKISADQMERIFAGLVVAGKEGRFELRDMARAFPVLTGHLANLGVTGAEAAAHIGAALQIAMRGAAEPTQAATNVENFLSKLLSKETIKNFEAKGVDITGVMEDAVWKGINPIEAALKKILALTGMTTAEISKLQARAATGGITDPAEITALSERIRAIRGGGEIAQMFGDMQVKNFLIPMLAGVADFKEIKEKIVTAMRGDPKAGVLADDFRSRMAGLEKQMERFAEVGEQSMRRVGNAFSSYVMPMNAGMERLLKNLTAIDARFPGLVDGILKWGGGALLAVAGLGLLGKAIGIIIAGLGVLAGLVGWPVVAAAAIAAAAVAIMENWEPVKAFFGELWSAIKTRFEAFGGWLKGWWDKLIPDWVRRVLAGGPAIPYSDAPGEKPPAGSKGFAPLGGARPQGEQKVGGKIVVEVQGPGTVKSVETENRNVPLTVDRGLMLGLP